jgi:hypothetical protein
MAEELEEEASGPGMAVQLVVAEWVLAVVLLGFQ